MSEFIIISFLVLFLVAVVCVNLDRNDRKYESATRIVPIQFFYLHKNQIFRYKSRWYQKIDGKTATFLDNNNLCHVIDWGTPVGALLDQLPTEYEKYILIYDEIY